MDLFFRSFRSSSAGNCLAVWTAGTSILIDFGVKTLRDCRAIVRGHRPGHRPLDGVFVTHAHGDHLSADGVRVLAEEGVPVYGQPRVVAQLRERHAFDDGGDRPRVQPFPGGQFVFGDFECTAIDVPHAPGFPTCGFVIEAGRGSGRRKMVVATDLHDASSVKPHLAGADFVFIESNHDPDLLRRHPNPHSRFHLSNPGTARLLGEAFGGRGAAPRMVVLGHLSKQRNRDDLALAEVEREFARRGLRVPFALRTAPKFEASPVMRVG
jgi:phosphoribosyl 1,2-cyclic phosphodiesterase